MYGLVQGRNAASSTAQSNVLLPSLELKAKSGVVSAVDPAFAGPESIVVDGAVLSGVPLPFTTNERSSGRDPPDMKNRCNPTESPVGVNDVEQGVVGGTDGPSPGSKDVGLSIEHWSVGLASLNVNVGEVLVVSAP